MELHPDFIAPRFSPHLLLLELDGDERRHVKSLIDNLQMMQEQANILAAARALFEHALQLPFSVEGARHSMYILWSMMAMREGALALSHFIKARRRR